MRLKSLIQAALGVYATILLAGCSTFYMNPETGQPQDNPPSPREVSYWQAQPGSFANKNPNADFSTTARYDKTPETDRRVPQYSIWGGVPQKKVVPAVSPSSTTGAPGNSAAGANATTGPMISTPPPPRVH